MQQQQLETNVMCCSDGVCPLHDGCVHEPGVLDVGEEEQEAHYEAPANTFRWITDGKIADGKKKLEKSGFSHACQEMGNRSVRVYILRRSPTNGVTRWFGASGFLVNNSSVLTVRHAVRPTLILEDGTGMELLSIHVAWMHHILHEDDMSYIQDVSSIAVWDTAVDQKLTRMCSTHNLALLRTTSTEDNQLSSCSPPTTIPTKRPSACAVIGYPEDLKIPNKWAKRVVALHSFTEGSNNDDDNSVKLPLRFCGAFLVDQAGSFCGIQDGFHCYSTWQFTSLFQLLFAAAAASPDCRGMSCR